MVTVETKVQQAIKEILIEETWKHLKTNNNFDKVLSIASLIEPYDEGPDPCEPYKETWKELGCVWVVTMDMFTLLTGEQVITYAQKTF